MQDFEASSPAAPPAPPVTDRVRLATLAVEAASKVDGVVEPHAPEGGGTSTRGSGGARVDGVVVVIGQEGRYDVALHLVARPVPLLPVADRVRDRLRSAARRAGLEARLGPIDVRFEDLAEP